MSLLSRFSYNSSLFSFLLFEKLDNYSFYELFPEFDDSKQYGED
jgi:hypothetical protein